MTVTTTANVVVTNTYPATGGGVLPPAPPDNGGGLPTTGISDLLIAVRLAVMLIAAGIALITVTIGTRRRRPV
jgi:hypothetical protein